MASIKINKSHKGKRVLVRRRGAWSYEHPSEVIILEVSANGNVKMCGVNEGCRPIWYLRDEQEIFEILPDLKKKKAKTSSQSNHSNNGGEG